MCFIGLSSALSASPKEGYDVGRQLGGKGVKFGNPQENRFKDLNVKGNVSHLTCHNDPTLTDAGGKALKNNALLKNKKGESLLL